MAYGGNLKSQVNMLLFVDTDGFQIDPGCISSFSRSLFFKEICYKVSKCDALNLSVSGCHCQSRDWLAFRSGNHPTFAVQSQAADRCSERR